MRKREVMIFLSALSLVSPALAGDFAPLGEPAGIKGEAVVRADRDHLIPGGDFEEWYYYWTCESDYPTPPCTVDLTVYDLWNYEGERVAWLGGWYNDSPGCWDLICQSDLLIDQPILTWWWMVYAHYGGIDVYVMLDGVTVFHYVTDMADHLIGYQQHQADLTEYLGSSHELCFYYSNEVGCENDIGDNYFFDYVELVGDTAAEEISFSMVKSLY